MDLDFHGRADLAQHLVARAEERLADADVPRLLSFYQCYRACVRGKVACLQSQSETMQQKEKEESLELARRYFQLALRYATLGAGSGVVVVMGKVASGKSTLALALGKMLGCEVLSSDRVRKALAGIPADKRGNSEERAMLYASGMTGRTYGELAEGAVKNLSHRGWTIVDATYSKQRDREALNSAISQKGGRCVWVEARAGDSATLERLRAREKSRGVISDARLEDRETLDAAYEPPDEMADCLSLENEGGVDQTIGRLLARLAERQGEG
jgi:predicted kinase